MKKGWVQKTLGEVCEVINGLWSGKKAPYVLVKVYSVSNFTKDSDLDCAKSPRIIHANAAQYEKRKLKFGDILIEKSGGGPKQPVGRAVYFNRKDVEKNTFSNFTTRLRINASHFQFIRSDYIQKYLKLLYLTRETKKFQTNSTNIRNLQLKAYLNIQIPIPPLAEQKEIVAVLDAAFAAIDKAIDSIKKNIANANELFQSKLNATFTKKGKGWVQKPLGEVCETSAGGTPSKSKQEYYTNGDIPWLRSGEVNNKKIIKSKIKITPTGLKNSSAKLFPPKTILIAMYGATAGEVGILNFNCSTNQAVCGILPNGKFTSKFLYFFFLSEKKNLKNQAIGNAQPNISQEKIKKTYTPIPPLAEQKEIVGLLEQLSARNTSLIATYNQKLANLEELKKSLLQKAFAGELSAKK